MFKNDINKDSIDFKLFEYIFYDHKEALLSSTALAKGFVPSGDAKCLIMSNIDW